MIEPDDDDEGDEWKRAKPEDNPKNMKDYDKKIIINNHSDAPWHMDQWIVRESEPMRTDIYFKNTYFSFVLDDKPRVEIFNTDQFGQIKDLKRTIPLGEYFTR